MNIITILFIAVVLALDSFSVAIANGIAIKDIKKWDVFKMAFAFGIFQGGMPVIGWAAGVAVTAYISAFDHWIAFILLLLIGGNMIKESIQKNGVLKIKTRINNMTLLGLAIATSIDALAVGLSFAFLDISIWMPVIVIGITSFILSAIGAYIGNKVGHFFEKRIQFVGGLILIGIGVKILIEHMYL